MLDRLPDPDFAFAGNVLRSLARFAVAVLLPQLATQTAYVPYVMAAAIEIGIQAIVTSLAVASMLTLCPGRHPDAQQALFSPARRVARVGVAGILLLGFLVSPFSPVRGLHPVFVCGFVLSLGLWSSVLRCRGYPVGIFQSRRGLAADGLGVGTTVALTVGATFIDDGSESRTGQRDIGERPELIECGSDLHGFVRPAL